MSQRVLNVAQLASDTVAERNPTPPGMYKTPVNRAKKTTSLNWFGGFLPSTVGSI